MINPNDVAKALRLIAEEIDNKGFDVILNYSVSCSEYGSVVVVTMRQPSYDINIQFHTDLLKRQLTYDEMRKTMSPEQFHRAVIMAARNIKS